MAELVAAELKRLGFRDVSVDRVGNVVGYLGQGPPRLMFNGHLDHVPPAGMSDPYEARIIEDERGSVLRGRGSCDMKANVAAGAYAVAFLRDHHTLAGTYVFTADVQEEIDSPAGVQALLERGVRADFGLSGESTGLAVSLGHRGKLQFDVVVEGRSSHASTPDAGINAVFRAVPFLQALDRAGADLPASTRFGKATLTVTGIRADPEEAVAVVPSACTIRVDRRYVPGETPTDIQRELEQMIADIAAAEGTAASVTLVNVYPLMTIDEDDPLVQVATAAVASVTGTAPELMAWRFGVNATFMSAAGIPTIGVGPGNEDWAHTRDEHVPIDELVKSSKIYAELIRRLCV